jgi:hypothetical protein
MVYVDSFYDDSDMRSFVSSLVDALGIAGVTGELAVLADYSRAVSPWDDEHGALYTEPVLMLFALPAVPSEIDDDGRHVAGTGTSHELLAALVEHMCGSATWVAIGTPVLYVPLPEHDLTAQAIRVAAEDFAGRVHVLAGRQSRLSVLESTLGESSLVVPRGVGSELASVFEEFINLVVASQDFLGPAVVSPRVSAYQALLGSPRSVAGIQYSSLSQKLPDQLADVGPMMLLPPEFARLAELDSALAGLPALGRAGRMIVCRSIEEWVDDPGMVAKAAESLSPFLMSEARW